MNRFSIFLAVLCIMAFQSHAQDVDEGLYSKPVPSDAVLIREVDKSGVKPYSIYTYKTAQKKLEELGLFYDLKKGGFYTLSLSDPNKFFEDKQVLDRTKAVLSFYNLTPIDGLVLKANNNISVFENVGSNQMVSRDINASKVSFKIYQGDKMLSETQDIIIERQNHYSLIFDGKVVSFAQAEVDY